MQNIITHLFSRPIRTSDNLETAVQRKLKYSSNGISEKTIGKLISRAHCTNTESITKVLENLKRETSPTASQMAKAIKLVKIAREKKAGDSQMTDAINLVTTAHDKEAGVTMTHKTTNAQSSHTLSQKVQYADAGTQTDTETPPPLPQQQASMPIPQPTPTNGANTPAPPPPPPPNVYAPRHAATQPQTTEPHAALAEQLIGIQLKQVEKQGSPVADVRDQLLQQITNGVTLKKISTDTVKRNAQTPQDELADRIKNGGALLRNRVAPQRAESVEEKPLTELQHRLKLQRSKSEFGEQ